MRMTGLSVTSAGPVRGSGMGRRDREGENVCWQWRATGTVWRIYHSGGVDAGLAGEAARLVEEDEARCRGSAPEATSPGSTAPPDVR